MQTLFENGRVLDWVLVAVALEALVLCAYNLKTGRGVGSVGLICNLAAGACLLLAVRAALQPDAHGWLAFWLTASLLAHLLDLTRRWR